MKTFYGYLLALTGIAVLRNNVAFCLNHDFQDLRINRIVQTNIAFQ
ncbi:MAG: hypothetical protein LBB36_00620 [Fibromonadaceae bacterium]|nr:hypothetical protein [Fibromonadaceae bacterium]